jgi:Bacterial conjugation TrbI-like protein
MKQVLIAILAGGLMGGPALAPAQNRAPQNSGTEPQGAALRIAPGSVIPVELTKGIDAKKAKTGDEVVAKVTQDMKTSNGEVLVPKDTKVVGRVTEAQPRSKEQKESEIGIAFDHAVMKNGSEMQLPMSIQAIIGPQNNQNSSGNSDAVPNGGSNSYPGPTRPGGMGGSTPAPTPSAPTAGSNMPGDTQTGKSARPPITAQTEGVVGISDLKLTTTALAANQGSLVSSEKNNVKLESGTLMLLRVNQ